MVGRLAAERLHPDWYTVMAFVTPLPYQTSNHPTNTIGGAVHANHRLHSRYIGLPPMGTKASNVAVLILARSRHSGHSAMLGPLLVMLGAVSATSQRTVLITGASSGIGLDAALALAEDGHRVFAGVRKQRDADRLESYAGIRPLRFDVTIQAQLDEAASSIASELGNRTLDAVVTSAGVGGGTTIGGGVAVAELSRQWNVNVLGVLRTIETMLPLMGPGGVLVNVGSVAGTVAQPNELAYGTSKAGVEALNNGLRLDLRERGLRVTLLRPGFVDTRMAGGAPPRSSTTVAIRHALTAETPQPFYNVADVHGIPTGTVLLGATALPTEWLDHVVRLTPHERETSIRVAVYGGILGIGALGLLSWVLFGAIWS